MAHLYPLPVAILLAIGFVCVHSQFYFHQPIRPLYIVQKNNQNPNQNPGGNLNTRPESISPSQFANRGGRFGQDEDEEFGANRDSPVGRADVLTSSEEELLEQEREREQEQNDGSQESSGEYLERRLNATQLPRGFDSSVRSNRPPLEPRPRPPLYGDPAVMSDGDDQERSRYLWPFSTTVTVTKNKHHHHSPPHHHHLSHPPGFTPHLFPPHLQHGHHGPHHHGDKHGDLEYEKTRLKYEIYKLKAKKTIAILQNKVELKKILSLLLQQKIKALEWVTW